MYYYYRVEDDKKYNVSLAFSMNECIYKYLTQKQKQSLNKYNLFTGGVVSNEIELRY